MPHACAEGSTRRGPPLAIHLSMLGRLRVPMSWGELMKRTLSAALEDNVMGLAAQQAYYFFFALFPALLALISLASFFPVANLTDELVRYLSQVAPKDVIDIVTQQLSQISESRAGGLLTFAFLVTLWTTSTAVVSMTTTLNAAYDVTESRQWWKVRIIAIGLTIGLALFILISMTLVVAGPPLARTVAENVGLGPVFVWTWYILQWPLIFTLVATGVALVYYFAPDVEQEWVWLTPGSILATLLWVGVSLGFSYYVSNFGDYGTYGVIGAVMVLMLWFWLSGLAILFGAELNAEIEHASPHGKDIGEKIPGEKKKIGALAAHEYEEKKANGEIPDLPFREGENCDIDRRSPAPEPSVRTSDLLIGTVALLPAALKLGREVRKQIGDDRSPRDDRAA